MKYLPLFNLEILHDFYSDQRCNDFWITPTPETERLLARYRCTLKYFPGGIRIIVAVTDEGIPFISLSADLILGFNLRLKNPDFALFTDLTEIGKAESPLFTNNGVEPNLSLVSRQTKITESFVVSQSIENEQFLLSDRPRPSLHPEDFDLSGLGSVIHPDKFDAEAKIITLSSKSVMPGSQFNVSYPSAHHQNGNIFAQVEISLKDPQTRKMDIEKNFIVSFTAKNARWKYYVVTDNSTFIPTIDDKESAVIFNSNDRTDLTNLPDPLDAIGKQLTEQYPKMHYFRFISSSLIPCRQTTRKAIQLQLNGEKVVDALPNPSFQNYTIDQRDSVKELSLYQVIKYFAR
jgi:hypothetical protein